MVEKIKKRVFQLEDSFRFEFISHSRISPDLTRVVYGLKTYHFQDEKTIHSIWLLDIDSTNPCQLTSEMSNSYNPEWSPDGKEIAFTSDRFGKPQIFIMRIDGGEPRQLTSLDQGVGRGPWWSPDGKYIAFTAGLESPGIDLDKPYRISHFVYRVDGFGNLNLGLQNIYILRVENGEIRQLTNDDYFNRDLKWDPDSSQILYLASFDTNRPELFHSRIRIVNLHGEWNEIIGLEWGCAMAANWLHEEEEIVFSGVPSDRSVWGKVDLYTVGLKGGVPKCISQDLKQGIFFWVPTIHTSTKAYVNVQTGGKIDIYSAEIRDEPSWKRITAGDRTAIVEDIQADKILFSSYTFNNPGELYLTDLNGTPEQRLINVNHQICSEINFPKIKNFHYKNVEGVEIEAWFIFPSTGEPPFPSVLYIHGGPHSAFVEEFRSDFHLLAGSGYGVLLINPRGSRGYGDDFSTILSGKWGFLDYSDLMSGVDYCINLGWVDPDRLGVCGISYGGYMTCFIVGQTNRFKAAVAENPITDLVSRYGTADMGAWGSLSELGGKPHEIPEVYRRSSPITYAHRCKTPTLLIQCEADYRCPVGQSEQFYTILKVNDCIVEMLRFPNVSHAGGVIGPVVVQKAHQEALVDWMKKYIPVKQE